MGRGHSTDSDPLVALRGASADAAASGPLRGDDAATRLAAWLEGRRKPVTGADARALYAYLCELMGLDPEDGAYVTALADWMDMHWHTPLTGAQAGELVGMAQGWKGQRDRRRQLASSHAGTGAST